MKEIKFSYNWNKKLSCDYFTTIRLSDKYEVGKMYPVTLKGRKLCYGKIVSRKRFLLSEVNDFIAYLDAGVDKDEFKRLIKTMYKNKGINWTKQFIYMYLIERKDVDLFDE